MNELITDVNWIAVVVGAVVAFGVGALWYSPKMFGTKWAEWNGLKLDNPKNMTCAMVLQFIATFLLARVVWVTAKNEALLTLILIIITIMALIISNGKWAQKSRYTIMTDAGFILVMGVIMVIAQAIL